MWTLTGRLSIISHASTKVWQPGNDAAYVPLRLVKAASVPVNSLRPHARGAKQAAAPALADPEARLSGRHADRQERLLVALLQCCGQPRPGGQPAARLRGLLQDQQARRAIQLLLDAAAACAGVLVPAARCESLEWDAAPCAAYHRPRLNSSTNAQCGAIYVTLRVF